MEPTPINESMQETTGDTADQVVETRPIQYIYAIRSNSVSDHFRFGGIECMKRIQTPCTSNRILKSLHSVFMVVPTLDYDKDIAQIKHSFRSKLQMQGWYVINDSEVRNFFDRYVMTGFQTDIQKLYDTQPEKLSIPLYDDNEDTPFWQNCMKNVRDYRDAH